MNEPGGRSSSAYDECYILYDALCGQDPGRDVEAYATMNNAWAGPYHHRVRLFLTLNEPPGQGLPKRDPWVEVPPQCVIDPLDLRSVTCEFFEPYVVEDFNSP